MTSRPLTHRAAAAAGALAVATLSAAAILPGMAAAAPSKHTKGTVRAVETEYHIALSKHTVAAPGRYKIVVVNHGTVTHGLVLDGPGLDDRSIGLIAPGHSESATVTLRKGRYDVYCPVTGHKMLGMNTHLTVRR